jgi:hypothetical protein
MEAAVEFLGQAAVSVAAHETSSPKTMEEIDRHRGHRA